MRRDRLALRSLRHALLCVSALVAWTGFAQATSPTAPSFRPGHADRFVLAVNLRGDVSAPVRDTRPGEWREGHQAAAPPPRFRAGHADALPATPRLPPLTDTAAPAGLRRSLADGTVADGATAHIAGHRQAAAVAASPALPHAQPSMSRASTPTLPSAALSTPPSTSAGRMPAFIAAMGRMGAPLPPPKPQGRAPVLTRAPLPLFQTAEPEVAINIPPPIRGSVGETVPIDVTATGSLPAGGQALIAAADPALPPGAAASASALARLSALDIPKPRKARAVTTPGGMRLAEAVASAVMTFPEIRINEARVREARAGISASEAGLYPNAELRVAAGQNFSGNYQGTAVPYKEASNSIDSRADAGIILRQLVFDFGATRADIRRAELLRDSEKLKLRDKVEEIAHRTAQNFLKVIEQREMLELIDEIIASHEHLAKVVQAHAKEGHGTLADVNRVASRLVDVRGIRSDISLQLMSAEDQFQRLTKKRAGGMADVPDLAANLPKTTTEAVQRVIGGSPRLGAISASRRSAQQELEYQRASALPRINLEIDGETKNFRSRDVDFGQSSARTQIEGRAMLSMRYRFMDGGLSNATREQINARIEGSEMTYTNEREQMEADIRQAYRAIESARRKGKLVSEGVASAERVRELYMEQFKGGKRTIFELLDGQMSYYTARRSQIESRYEGRRAAFDVLRAMGELTSTLAGTVPRRS
ncbi:MAG: TolC family protein [Bosea sp. (in: a-proteobacteria)]